ncbi:MAG TPA: PAS domain S-box protein, partial [Casimicrobiaceae bacterium]
GLLESNPELLEIYGRVALTGRPERFESYIKALHIWLSIGAYCPAPGEFVALFENITERRIAEAALHNSEERRSIFVRHAPAAIAMFDRDMRYLAVSRRFLADYGLGDRDIVGLGHYEVFPEVPERWKAIHRRCLGGAIEKCDEDLFPRGDGHTDWIRWEIRPWHDERGAIGGLLLFSEVITERKAAERAVADSAELARAVGDSVLAQMAVLDRAGNIISVNKSWTQFALENSVIPGTPAEHTGVGANYLDICRDAPGEYKEEALRALDGIGGVLRGERGSFTLEYACHAPNQKRWFQLSATPLNTPEGGAVVVHIDISDRVQAELAVRESEVNYRTMITSLSEGVMVFDSDGAVRTCNPSAERILRQSQAQMLAQGRSIANWRPIRPDGTPVPTGELPVAKVLATGESQSGVVLGDAGADGRIAWLLLNAEPIRDVTSGELRGAVISFTDITERFASDQELRKLSLAVEQSPESILITDLGGRIEYVNEAFTHVSGYSREEALGQNPRLLQSDRTPPATYKALWQALANGESWRGELVNRRKNGEHYTEFAHISPVRRFDGRITHYVAIQEDVTQRKVLEHELDQHRHHLENIVSERTRELLAANRALVDAEHFATAVSENIPGGVAYWDRDSRCRF